MTLDDDTLAGATRGRLYLWAQELDIRGRGSMSRDELAAALRARLQSDWIVLAKGSRAAGMERVVAVLRENNVSTGETDALPPH